MIRRLNLKRGVVTMCIAIEKEQVVAGFVNRNKDGAEFTMRDIDDYIRSLWNAGCGPVRVNFTDREMRDYLDRCDGVCLRITPRGYRIDKSLLSSEMTQEEREFLQGDPELARSLDLFCRLQVDLRTPNSLLDAMGFRFMYA